MSGWLFSRQLGRGGRLCSQCSCSLMSRFQERCSQGTTSQFISNPSVHKAGNSPFAHHFPDSCITDGEDTNEGDQRFPKMFPSKGTSQFKWSATPFPKRPDTSETALESQIARKPTVFLPSLSIPPSDGISIQPSPHIPVASSVGLSNLTVDQKAQSTHQSPPFLGKAHQSSRLVRPRSPLQPQALRRAKRRATIRVILLGSTLLLLGGVTSFHLLRLPTYLIVSWIILVIVFSHLASQQLRSSYRLAQKMLMTTLHLRAIRPATLPHDDEIPILKDIDDTTAYLKALCLECKISGQVTEEDQKV